MKRFLAVAALVGLMAGMMAVPAAANPQSGVVIFNGEANVNPPLTLPTINQKVSGTYHFRSVLGCVAMSLPGGVELCEIDVSGIVAPGPFGIGAACGMSHGHSGVGRIDTPNGLLYAVSNVGWITSVPGTLVIYGTWTRGGQSGQLLGLVRATGGVGCLNGASAFHVVGRVEAL